MPVLMWCAVGLVLRADGDGTTMQQFEQTQTAIGCIKHILNTQGMCCIFCTSINLTVRAIDVPWKVAKLGSDILVLLACHMLQGIAQRKEPVRCYLLRAQGPADFPSRQETRCAGL